MSKIALNRSGRAYTCFAKGEYSKNRLKVLRYSLFKGEVGNVALECRMELVEVEFHLHPDLRIDFPRAYTPTDWITLGFHEDLDEAATFALDFMLDLIVEEFKLERKEALALCATLDRCLMSRGEPQKFGTQYV